MSLRSFMEAHSVDRSVHRGSMALRCGRYVADGAAHGPPIEGLRVRDGERDGRWHASTGVYGFVDAPSGLRELLVEDPAGHHLPRRVMADFPDRAATPDPGARWLSLAMLPTLALPISPAETVIWGALRDAADQPVPLAFVRVSTATRSFRALSDLQGTFLLWLVGERIDEADLAPALTVRAHPLLVPPDPDAPWRSIPLDLESLAPLSPAFNAVYRSTSSDVTAPVRTGTRVRVDVTVV